MRRHLFDNPLEVVGAILVIAVTVAMAIAFFGRIRSYVETDKDISPRPTLSP